MPDEVASIPELDAFLDDPALWEAIEQVIVPANKSLWDFFSTSIGYLAVAAAVRKVADQLNQPKATPADTSKYARDFFEKRGAVFITQVSETDRAHIKDLLRQHWGVGEAAFARLVKDDWAWSEARAKLIFRQESHTAHEGSAYQYAGDCGAWMKQWRTAGDERVRERHAIQNNQVVRYEETFDNGELWPGEIACRCTIYYFLEGAKIPAYTQPATPRAVA